jgi:isoleucyl-tRNA synthetase
LGRAARSAADIKLRQPLAAVRVNVGSQQEQEDLLELAPVLREEINVKEIEVVSEVGELVNYKLLPNNRVLGPRLGKMFPAVNQALKEIDPAQAARSLQAGEPVVVEAGGQMFELGPDDLLVQTESRGGLAVASDKGVTVAVDTSLTPELLREGYARDLVRAINNMRKEAGFDISDRILLVYKADGEAAAAIQDFGDYIQQETLSVALDQGTMDNPTFEGEVNLGDQDVLIAFRLAD